MTLMAWQDWVGNLCYALLAASYLVTNMYWLRALAIVALGLEGVYFYFSADSQLWVGIGWAVVFVSINIVQLAILTRNRLRVRLSDEEQALYGARFSRLDPVAFNSLARSGHWQDLAPESVLAREGHPVDCLYLLVRGAARVESAGRTVATLRPGSFAGEMSFLSGDPATATVTALDACRVFAVPQERLRVLLQENEEIKLVLQELLGHDLVQKLRAARGLPATGLARPA